MARELAILVTARNMASGVLKEVRGDVKGIQSEARRGLQNTARNLGFAAAAGGVLVATQVKAGIDSLIELERVTAQTNAALESTGSVAAGSVADIRKRSEALEDLTTIDDKVIQNAQNLLLTFPEIGEKAFQPTLEAALDLNAALGGDEESLQGVLLQVAKAVNDPIRGMTALRRSGVSFTKEQQDQVKAMVEVGDVAGAQALVLEELNKQFGGSAAAQADTYAGKMRRVGDAVEGAQMALATAFLPVLERVGDELQTFLADPKNLAAIQDFGGVLAEGLDDAIDIAKKLPWDAIGSTFEVMGKGARTVLDMFTQLPPWVQTAVLTSWGLNKLTGGALGNIFSTLASGLIKGVLGINAGVVNINAATVNGGTPGTGGRGGTGKLPLVAGLATLPLALTSSENPSAMRQHNEAQLARGEITQAEFDAMWNHGALAQDIRSGLKTEQGTGTSGWAEGLNGVKQSFESGTAQWARGLNDLTDEVVELPDTSMLQPAVNALTTNLAPLNSKVGQQLAAVHNLNASEGRRFSSTLGTLQAIRNKRTTFNPNVNVTANLHNTVVVSGQQTIYRLQSLRQSLNQGTSTEGFI
jgi:hypothetical protein